MPKYNRVVLMGNKSMAVADRRMIEGVFEKVGKRIKETKRKDIVKFVAKEAAGSIPFVGHMIKDAFGDFSSDEKKRILKELKQYSETQFREMSYKLDISADSLKDIQKIILYSFEQLQADKKEIKELLHRLIEASKVSIPTIQSVLKKEEIPEGDFFRKEPAWIDFETGYIVERKEVDEIIEKLKKCSIHLVVGAPATGKSVVLKNVGFRLTKEDQNVYVIELKKNSQHQIELYFKEVLRMKDEASVFIIDDAHLQLSACERFVREFKGRKLKAKVLVGSRPIEGILERSPKEASEFEYMSKTLLRAEDATEDIIEMFLRKKYHFSKKRIREMSGKLEKYKKDLWHLSWALKAYDPEKDSIEEEQIYEKIKDSIRTMGTDAEDVLFPVSAFYMFEIPIERSFLEEQIGVEEGAINQLIDLSEIVETEQIGKGRTVSLTHSSIAQVYLQTYQNYPSLGRKVKKLLQNDNVEHALFHWYMTKSDPTNSLNIIHRLTADHSNEYGGQTLLLKLLENEKIKDQIHKGIGKEKDLDNIATLISSLPGSENRELRHKLVESVLDWEFPYAVWPKLASETDLEKIGDFFLVFLIEGREYGNYIASGLNHHVLLKKIEKEKDVAKIGWCISGIACVDKELGLILTHSLNLAEFSSKLQKEGDMKKLVSCIFDITSVDEELGLDLAKKVDFSKIRKEEDIYELTDHCVSCGSLRLLQEIAENLNSKVKNYLRSFLEYAGCRDF